MQDLFAYGDIDDIGNKARLQHPLGVALVSDEGPLYVADSYNHKVSTGTADYTHLTNTVTRNSLCFFLVFFFEKERDILDSNP